MIVHVATSGETTSKATVRDSEAWKGQLSMLAPTETSERVSTGIIYGCGPQLRMHSFHCQLYSKWKMN